MVFLRFYIYIQNNLVYAAELPALLPRFMQSRYTNYIVEDKLTKNYLSENNMKSFITLIIFLILFSNITLAQQDTLNTEKTFGFGITFEQERYYIPINISQLIRLEPEFYINNFESDDNEFYNYKYNRIKIGIGIFPKYKIRNTWLYAGIRIGYQFDDSKDREYKNTDEGYYVIPALGGEYLIENLLSFGIEFQLKYTSYDNRNLMADKSEVKEYNSRQLSTLTLFFIRIYIW